MGVEFGVSLREGHCLRVFENGTLKRDWDIAETKKEVRGENFVTRRYAVWALQLM
jgi:hypothetical protein